MYARDMSLGILGGSEMKGNFKWAAVCFLMLYPAIKERACVQDGRDFQECASCLAPAKFVVS